MKTQDEARLARRRDPIWDALVDCFREPSNANERGRLNKAVKLVRESIGEELSWQPEAGELVKAAVARAREEWGPDVTVTATAIASNWTQLSGLVPVTDLFDRLADGEANEARVKRIRALQKLWRCYPSRKPDEFEVELYLRQLSSLPGDELLIAVEEHLAGPNAARLAKIADLKQHYAMRVEQLRMARSLDQRQGEACPRCQGDGWIEVPTTRKVQVYALGTVRAREVVVGDAAPCPDCPRGGKIEQANYGSEGFWRGRTPESIVA